MCILTVCLWFSAGGVGLAATEAVTPAQPPADSGATNLPAAYSTIKEKLPPVPVPPASMEDAKGTAAYIVAVDVYLKAARQYIDAATNDANRIVAERNNAVQSANQVVDAYNAFFKLNEKK